MKAKRYKTHPLILSILLAGFAPALTWAEGEAAAPAAAPAEAAPAAPAPEVAAAPAPVAEAKLIALKVYPETLSLGSATDRERVIFVAQFDDGITKEVTKEAAIKFSAEGIAKFDEEFYLNPVGDGEATLEASYGGQTVSVKVAVKNAQTTNPKSFKLDIEPVLMRAGCNSGGCHGAASGKNGFKLSLFGFDSEMDYINLTRQTGARRLTTADSAESLMLTKATTGVAHEGGERFKPDSPLYQMVSQWIKEGANKDPDTVAKLTGVEIFPKQMVLYGSKGDQAGYQHRLTVRATYSDGTDRDVTHLSLMSSMNDTSAAISGDGIVTAKERGEASIIARFGTYAVVTQAIVVPPGEALVWPEGIEERNYVDQLINKKLKQLRITPSEVCSDETFVRRVYVDIVGLIPKTEDVEKFLADTAPDKRAKLVDELLQRPEFPELWAMKWAEILRVESSSQRISYKAMFLYTNWLRDQIVQGVPVDKMAREMLTAKGGNFTNPAANFYMIEGDPKLMAENVAQVFTGIRIQCAQCHNHPFERWTMDDYYSFSAFFAQVGRKGSEDPRETIVFNAGGGEVGHIKDGRAMAPKVLGTDKPADLQGRDRREVLAEWLTSPENPWFSKNIANRVWAHFMGKGIVDPPDDVRVSNPPVNPELFDTLGNKLVESGYDLRQLVRDICNSRTYQVSTLPNKTNETDLTNFSHRIPRRMGGEQLLDAICQVTETPEKYRGQPLGARATQVADGNTGNYFLSIFGRPLRNSACTCDRRNEPTLSQALHLINGGTIGNRIQAGQGRLARMIAAQKTTAEITNDIYLAAYSRKPTAEEMQRAEKFIAEATDPKQGYEDLYWAVLNSKEFVFLH